MPEVLLIIVLGRVRAPGAEDPSFGSVSRLPGGRVAPAIVIMVGGAAGAGRLQEPSVRTARVVAARAASPASSG
jgi:hypothetical protein